MTEKKADPLEEFLDSRLLAEKKKPKGIYVRFSTEERAELEDGAWLLTAIAVASGKKPTRNTKALGSISKRWVLKELRRLFEAYGGRPKTPEQKAEAKIRLAERFGTSAEVRKARTKVAKK